MEVYINGTGCISPQNTFEESSFNLNSLQAASSSRLKCIDPEYKNYINLSQLRRMSRMIRMGIASAKLCLERAQVSMPDAIITGTGLGCIEDTEKFISSILENNEQLLTPTPFIQSTHNTVGGQIALLLGCHAYNYTYVHRGISFESSLLDATMMIRERSAENILAGGIDELTDHSYLLLQQLGIYSRQKSVASDLSNGTPGGEGSAFFLLSGKKLASTRARLSLIKTFPGKNDPLILVEKIRESLKEAGKKPENIDLILSGRSGHSKTDVLHAALNDTFFKKSAIQTFKQYCGEYHTASAFALWLAVQELTNHSSVLVSNQFGGEDHSLLLVERC